MSDFVRDRLGAGVVPPHDIETFDVFGPTVEYLTAPDEADAVPCVMRGTIPRRRRTIAQPSRPGDVRAGFRRGQGILGRARRSAMDPHPPGDVFHVAGGARHAFRNLFDKPSVAVIVTTSNLGRFFQEIGERKLPEADLPGSPSQETLRRFLEVSEKYGYWNAT
jgi:hypothetical protein